MNDNTNLTINTNIAFTIVYKSDEHPRTINTPRNGRTNYSVIDNLTESEAIDIYCKLRIQGVYVYYISGQKHGKWPRNYDVYKDEHGKLFLAPIPSRGIPLHRW